MSRLRSAALRLAGNEFFLDAGATNLELTKVQSSQANSIVGCMRPELGEFIQ